MESLSVSRRSGAPVTQAGRLFYLDWLRVLATLGVFLFHVSCVFSGLNYEIVNNENSETLFIITAFFFPWGMPLFFLVAGGASWFALRRRAAGQFRRERVYRLLVPFLTGTILLGPVQLYLSWRHRTETGVFDGSFPAFVVNKAPQIGPKWFGAYGYHMWFLGFLFAFSLLALPIFVWLKGENGRRVLSRLAGLCAHRGGILIFVLPPTLTRLGLQSYSPGSQAWADFFTYGVFFVMGFLLFSNEKFSEAIWRDRWILLAVGIISTVAVTAIGMSLESFDIERAPRTSWELVMWGLIAVCGWCWVAFMLFAGARFLNRDSEALRYGQLRLLPFFVVHQPVILFIAYFVVGWEASIPVKMLVVTLGAFTMSIGVCELVIKRVGFLRALFGMKAGQPGLPRPIDGDGDGSAICDMGAVKYR
jgi:glucan biosynthesis protein C